MIYDVIIIGMGPAGVSAAIYAKRAGLNVLCLDQAMIGGYLNYIDKIDNYPGLYGISGPDFAYKLYEHVNSLDIEFKNKKVLSIVDGDVKKVITNDDEYLCKYIIIATGRESKKIGLENEDILQGKGISHCALCDGAFYKNKVVAVVGGGDSALQEALHLSNIAEKVYLIHRRDEFRAINELVDRVNEKDNIVKIMKTNVVSFEINDDKLNGLLLDSGDSLEVDGLFVYIGFVPTTSFAKDLEITNKDGYIVVNKNYESSRKGIYAIGDIIEKDIYQISTGVAEGVIAAVNIIEKCK